jgi:hypothetical protein
VSVVFCQAEVSATGRSLVQRSPNECGVSECFNTVFTAIGICHTSYVDCLLADSINTPDDGQ